MPGGKPGGLNPGGGPDMPGGGKGIGGPTEKYRISIRMTQCIQGRTRRHHSHPPASRHTSTRTDWKLEG